MHILAKVEVVWLLTLKVLLADFCTVMSWQVVSGIERRKHDSAALNMVALA
jgi:hypothetical protein